MLDLASQCWAYRGVLRAQTTADLRSSVVGTRLGYVWWLLDPLMLLAVYYFVIAGVFDRGGPDFVFHLFCGLVVWQWFARSMAMSATAYTRNKGLILAVPVPLPLYVLSPILVHAIFAVIGLLLLIVIYDPGRLVVLPQLLALMLLQALVTFALGTLLAALTVFLRDLAKFAEYGVRVLFYFSPILYDASLVRDSDRIAEPLKQLWLLNPFAHLVPAYQALVFDTAAPWTSAPLVLLGVFAAVLALAFATTASLRNRIPQSL